MLPCPTYLLSFVLGIPLLHFEKKIIFKRNQDSAFFSKKKKQQKNKRYEKCQDKSLHIQKTSKKMSLALL